MTIDTDYMERMLELMRREELLPLPPMPPMPPMPRFPKMLGVHDMPAADSALPGQDTDTWAIGRRNGFLDDDQMQQVISRIGYKKNFRFNAGWMQYGPLWRAVVTVRTIVPDRDDPKRTIELELKRDFGGFLTVVHMWRTIYALIRDLEIHEIEESFTFDGVRVFDPHAGDK